MLDTGVIVALLDRSEDAHEGCAEAVRALEAPLLTSEAVIAESCYLPRNLSGAPEAVIDNAIAGIFQIPLQLSRECSGVRNCENTGTGRSISRNPDVGSGLCDLSLGKK